MQPNSARDNLTFSSLATEACAFPRRSVLYAVSRVGSRWRRCIRSLHVDRLVERHRPSLNPWFSQGVDELRTEYNKVSLHTPSGLMTDRRTERVLPQLSARCTYSVDLCVLAVRFLVHTVEAISILCDEVMRGFTLVYHTENVLPWLVAASSDKKPTILEAGTCDQFYKRHMNHRWTRQVSAPESSASPKTVTPSNTAKRTPTTSAY
jgi:hypothetical protein